jgi:Zn-dependent M28 family amino/carboxypeptidase
MRTVLLAALATLAAAPVLAQPAAVPALPAEPPRLRDLPAQVSPERMRADIARMVSFGTRHTLSDAKSDKRGIGAARRWVASEFQAISRDCGGCLTIATPSAVVTAPPRVPVPTEIVDVLAIQRGTGDPNRVVVISGHLDSRVSDVMNATADAPGANDDASGVAAVIEAARVLSKQTFAGTIVYAALSGEEQGLHGGKILADYAKSQGWFVVADLNNDIVGNTEGIGGARDNTHVRVFSEGTKAVETPEEANRRRYNGGEVDSPSRQLARYLDGLADRYLQNFDVVMVYRTDRFGRGGDQVRMLEAGYPAVRITEAVENYNRQHQDLRTKDGIRYGDTLDGVDFPYLAQVTRLNVLGLAALAAAPAPPSGVEISGAVSADTTVKWTPARDAAAYRVWWRGTTDPTWRYSRTVPPTGEARLTGVNIDDWFFGVSAVGPDGHESPVVYPGAPGRWISEPARAAK